LHITEFADRVYIHHASPEHGNINALTAVFTRRLFVFTAFGVFYYNSLTDNLPNEAGPEDLPPLPAEGWTLGHIPL
jgi:hypothetical protein